MKENHTPRGFREVQAKGSERFLTPIFSLMFSALLAVSIGIGYAAAQQAPDNTGRNKDQANPTADNQKMNAPDREMTQKIRKAIHQDKALSTYAHNIKIIGQDGKVTLRGPVRSEDEKNNLQAKAVAAAGDGNVNKPARNCSFQVNKVSKQS
jgi:hyperosmotically inducible protein